MSPASATGSPWTGLPLDLQLEVVGRLQDAVDVVRFHAVCRPWRDAAALLAPAATHTACLAPWVLGTCNGALVHSVVDFRCSFQPLRPSHDVVLEKPRRSSGTNDTNWVATGDGTAALLFVAHPSPRLIDLLTGAVVRLLPPFPDDAAIRRKCENFRGIRYDDGTVFLYNFDSKSRWNPSWPDFIAATLRPGGDATWTVVKKGLNLPVIGHACAAYHDGKILVCTGGYLWCVLTPDTEASGGDIGGMLVPRLEASEDPNYHRIRNYVLVSGGELWWVSVVLGPHHPIDSDLTSALSVTVQALQEEPGGSGKMRWVSRSLNNRVLFLETSASFATQLDSGISCAYFVHGWCMYRYNFGQGETKLVKLMNAGCGTYDSIMWLRPSLSFAPIQKIRERLEAQNKK